MHGRAHEGAGGARRRTRRASARATSGARWRRYWACRPTRLPAPASRPCAACSAAAATAAAPSPAPALPLALPHVPCGARARPRAARLARPGRILARRGRAAAAPTTTRRTWRRRGRARARGRKRTLSGSGGGSSAVAGRSWRCLCPATATRGDLAGSWAACSACVLGWCCLVGWVGGTAL